MAQSFGRYQLLERIGQGGMAEVYLALQHGPGGFEKPVALKVMLPLIESDPDLVRLFLSEAKLAAKLSHPNICQIFDIGQEGERYFIAMEYLPGQSLSSVRRRAKVAGEGLPSLLEAWIVANAANGLAHAHERADLDGRSLAIIHGDVSPANIVVTYDGQVKVVDFGLASTADRIERARAIKTRGTPRYMAPERILGLKVDTRSDVFSLGVILYEALAGTSLFSEEGDPMQQVLTSPIPPLAGRPEVPTDLWHAVEAALERNCDTRLSSARELARRIESALGGREPRPSADALAIHLKRLFGDDQAHLARRLELEGCQTRSIPSLALPEHRAEIRPEPTSAPSEEAPKTRPLPPAPRRGFGRKQAFFGLAGSLVLSGIAGLAIVSPELSFMPAPSEPERATASDPTPSPVHAREESAPRNDENAPAPSKGLSLEGDTPKPSAPPAGTRAPSPKRAAHGRANELGPAERTPRRTATPKRIERATPQVPMGRLTLDTTPWTEVFIDAHRIGVTPLFEVELPAGPHRLRVVNDRARVDQFIDVEVIAGKTTGLHRKL